jgi:hypothetical protein
VLTRFRELLRGDAEPRHGGAEQGARGGDVPVLAGGGTPAANISLVELGKRSYSLPQFN